MAGVMAVMKVREIQEINAKPSSVAYTMLSTPLASFKIDSCPLPLILPPPWASTPSTHTTSLALFYAKISNVRISRKVLACCFGYSKH